MRERTPAASSGHGSGEVRRRAGPIPAATLDDSKGRVLASIGVRVTPALTLNNPEAVKGAAVASLGVAILPRMCAAGELRRGELVEVSVRGWKASRTLHALTLRAGRPPKSVAALLAVLAKAAKATDKPQGVAVFYCTLPKCWESPTSHLYTHTG